MNKPKDIQSKIYEKETQLQQLDMVIAKAINDRKELEKELNDLYTQKMKQYPIRNSKNEMS